MEFIRALIQGILRQGRHAALYRHLITGAASKLFNSLDTRLARRRVTKKELQEAANFAASVKVGDKVYATDGTGSFYWLCEKASVFSDFHKAMSVVPSTYLKIGAERIFLLHQGKVTTTRPDGFVSAATLSAANHGGVDGSPMEWAPVANPHYDYNPALAHELARRHNSVAAAFSKLF